MTVLQIPGLEIIPASVVIQNNDAFFLHVNNGQKQLVHVATSTDSDGSVHVVGSPLFWDLTAQNAAMLRRHLPWLNPVPLGLRTSAGFGDRLGRATPGHVLAVQGTGVAPIFAQQSVRENARTGRSPQTVVDDAMWSLFEMGWRDPWGADADHLKQPELVEAFVTAGYSFFTVDPGEHVDTSVEHISETVLEERVNALDWTLLDSSPADLRQRFEGKTFTLDTQPLTFDRAALLRAAAKYGRAVAHITRMYRHLRGLMGDRPFDFEVSVDETDSPTSIHEHYYIAAELRRLGIVWTSLAPRFVGRFEKGVDYIGDLGALDQNLAGHAAVMRCLGPYKISLHSGSDKFSVYPLATRHAAGLVHLKTAGTSYLEALRVWAEVEPTIFRQVFDFARQRYETDRATYHVSAELAKVPAARDLSDTALPGLLDQFDARQVLHVTYGSVLDQFGDQLDALLRRSEDRYAATLKQHFARHLESFREQK
jgi:hypothetical protein